MSERGKSGGDFLVELLKPARLTTVADIGANPIDGEPPYKPLLAARLCRVVGFEPLPHALAALNSRKSDLETYLPYVIGDGNPATLRVCESEGMTSLLRPDPQKLRYFTGFESWGRIVKELPVETRRLNDVDELGDIDFLKIDAQGSELSIFRHGSRRLANAVAIQTEAAFMPLYEQQPTLGEIDSELRQQGFVPHCFANIKNWMIAPMFMPNYAALNQLLESDIVYVRDFTRPDTMTPEQLKHLTIIAHHCYQSFDLAAHCLQQLAKSGAVPSDALGRYLGQGAKR